MRNLYNNAVDKLVSNTAVDENAKPAYHRLQHLSVLPDGHQAYCASPLNRRRPKRRPNTPRQTTTKHQTFEENWREDTLSWWNRESSLPVRVRVLNGISSQKPRD